MPTVTTNQSYTVCTDHPHQVALIGLGNRGEVLETITFSEANALIDTLAAELSETYSAGTTIGLVAANSPAWVIAFYAAQRARCVPVPISHRMPAATVDYIVNDAELALVFTDDQSAYLLDDSTAVAAIRSLDTLLQDLRRTPTTFDATPNDPEEPAMMLYTSGSTGSPKGVVLSHRSHLWVIAEGSKDQEPARRILIAAPLYHMNALGMTQRSLAIGQTVVLLPRFEATQYLQAIDKFLITDLSGVPPMFSMIAAERQNAEPLDLTSVEVIYMSSAPAARDLFVALDELFGSPHFVYRYGTTEAGPLVFDHPADGAAVPYGSVGVRHPDVDLRLLDDSGLTGGTVGTLQIRCPAMMSGYHRRPDVSNPITADGFYHTKDVFRVDDKGFWYFVGREDDMFVSGGENIYPRSVEIALESHPAVSQAVVVPIPDVLKGTKPVAYVQLIPGMHANPHDLRAHSLLSLEPAAHPRAIWIVDDFPLAATNKIDRHSLTRRAASQVDCDR